MKILVAAKIQLFSIAKFIELPIFINKLKYQMQYVRALTNNLYIQYNI